MPAGGRRSSRSPTMSLAKPSPSFIMSDLHSIRATTGDGVSATAFRSRRVRQLFAWRPARRRRFAAEGVDARADSETREPDSLAGYGIRRYARLARRAYRSDDASDRRDPRQGRRLRRL